MKYRIIFEGQYGTVLERVLALDEIKSYVWPGWLALWEEKRGEDILSLISPELLARYRALLRSVEQN